MVVAHDHQLILQSPVARKTPSVSQRDPPHLAFLFQLIASQLLTRKIYFHTHAVGVPQISPFLSSSSNSPLNLSSTVLLLNSHPSSFRSSIVIDKICEQSPSTSSFTGLYSRHQHLPYLSQDALLHHCCCSVRSCCHRPEQCHLHSSRIEYSDCHCWPTPDS